KHVDTFSNNTLFDELTRTDPRANDEAEDVDEEKQEVFEQPFSTWHRENENSDRKQNLLQFELDVGTKTNILGGDARETEDGDQAMGSVQGTSRKSKQNDYSETETLDKQEPDKRETSHGMSFGNEHKHAVAIHRNASRPTEAEQDTYEQ